jgi:hypothetical protein
MRPLVRRQVDSESEKYLPDFARFLGYNRVQYIFLLPFLVEQYPTKVDDIWTKNVSTFPEVKIIFSNLPSGATNGDSALHIFTNEKNTSRIWEPNLLVLTRPKPALHHLEGCHLYLKGKDLYLVYHIPSV